MDIATRTLAALLGSEYAEQRRLAAERLYNALADVVNEEKPTVETVLYVLEGLKANILAKALGGTIPLPPPAGEAAPVKLGGWREAAGRKAKAEESDSK